MRASILFAFGVALLLALGAAVAVKYSGLLNQPVPVAVAAPAPPEVLVANQNIYGGDVIRQEEIRMRPATPEEQARMAAGPHDYITVMQSAIFRVTKENIEAGTPILKSNLSEIGRPKPLNTRMLPMTRAVNVEVTRENCAGGLVATDDWVDVLLTTEIGRTDDALAVNTQTAVLAHNVQIIVKNDQLWRGNFPVPTGAIQFTLAPNLYRAALIDFARTQGSISLVPVPVAEKAALDAMKEDIKATQDMKGMSSRIIALSVRDTDSPGYRDEESRLQAYSRGETAVGDADLIRVFGLKSLALADNSIASVEFISGVQHRGTATFNEYNAAGVYVPAGERLSKTPGYRFGPPKGPAGGYYNPSTVSTKNIGVNVTSK